METSKSVEERRFSGTPSPLEFDLFLPWACKQLGAPEHVIVKKNIQTDYVGVGGPPKGRDKARSMKTDLLFDIKEDEDEPRQTLMITATPEVYITAIYDKSEQLSQLIFNNNNTIPRLIFKVLGLIIQYHSYLNTITINKGLNQYTLYEISKFLPYSQITEICLDNALVKEGNYYLLLEQQSMLRSLSLKRCGINDVVVEAIAKTIIYPNPASKTLAIFDLASNRITDDGAKHLSEALRSNRTLKYLNLADNSITDTGGEYLLNTLKAFPLLFGELLASRTRKIEFLKGKKELTVKMAQSLRAGEHEKQNPSAKSKSKKATSAKPKSLERENSLKSLLTSKSLPNINQIINEKAAAMADSQLGEFNDPFDKANTKIDDAIVYCDGNNSLCYLNLAYNNLSYMSLKKLVTVLKYQKEMGRNPQGLINVIIEGNYMPVTCAELDQIGNIIEMGIIALNKKNSVTRKRPQAKTILR